MTFGFVDEHRGVWPVRVICAGAGLETPERVRQAGSSASPAHAPGCGIRGGKAQAFRKAIRSSARSGTIARISACTTPSATKGSSFICIAAAVIFWL
jgi:hypothetical protein